MHITLHLTDDCNMACGYCYQKQGSAAMDFGIATKAIELLASDDTNCGIVFFGGEPLLEKDLIWQIVEWCESFSPGAFHYKITTNGLLIDHKFMEQATMRNLHVALSHDGVQAAHDLLRLDKKGAGTFDRVNQALTVLLEYQPYAPILLTVNPETISSFSESVMFLQSMGVQYLVCSINYAGDWTEHHLKSLEREYRQLSKWHASNYRNERKFYFSPFDKRIATHVFSDRNQSCLLGIRQVSVSTGGTFYPCVQFVGHNEYEIGSVSDGINHARRREIFEMNEADKPCCSGCTLERRCHNKCGCLNFQTTRSIETLPPVLCEHERIIYPIADRLAETLYKEREPMFLQRHYNNAFPILSYLEDLSP